MIGEHFYAFVSSPQHVCETLNFTFVRIDTAIGLRAVEVSPESQNNKTPPASKIADGGASDTRAVPAPTIRLVSYLAAARVMEKV